MNREAMGRREQTGECKIGKELVSAKSLKEFSAGSI